MIAEAAEGGEGARVVRVDRERGHGTRVQGLHFHPGAIDGVAATTVAQGTTLVVVNSVCGCAARNARPAVAKAIRNETRPDTLTTVFAGQDADATAELVDVRYDMLPVASTIAAASHPPRPGRLHDRHSRPRRCVRWRSWFVAIRRTSASLSRTNGSISAPEPSQSWAYRA